MSFEQGLFNPNRVGGGGVVLRSSSDGDDRTILGGLKFSIPGFCFG